MLPFRRLAFPAYPDVSQEERVWMLDLACLLYHVLKHTKRCMSSSKAFRYNSSDSRHCSEVGKLLLPFNDPNIRKGAQQHERSLISLACRPHIAVACSMQSCLSSFMKDTTPALHFCLPSA